jgi:hypothetical protein
MSAIAQPAATNPASPAKYDYEQPPIVGRPALVAPEEVAVIVQRFRAVYAKLGSPRMLIYVNRELVDGKSGLRPVAATEKLGNTGAAPSVVVQPAKPPGQKIGALGNGGILGGTQTGDGMLSPGKGKLVTPPAQIERETTYRYRERPGASLADRQLARDIERGLGRPLRQVGVSLADQGVATDMAQPNPLKAFDPSEASQAAKERAALAKVTDVVVEVLVSTRTTLVREISGDREVQVPDLQATAIRLKDARILGQASSVDVIGRGQQADRLSRQHELNEIAEATALALMQDMAMSAGK